MYCLGPEITAKYTWHGKRDKKALKVLKVAKAIEKSLVAKGITVSELELEVGNWMRHTGDRFKKALLEAAN